MKINWDQIPKFEPPKLKKTKRYKKLRKLVRHAKSEARGSWQRDFCKSVKKQLKEKRDLSSKQVAVLNNIIHPPKRDYADYGYTPPNTEPRPLSEAEIDAIQSRELDNIKPGYWGYPSGARIVEVYAQDFGGEDTDRQIGYYQYTFNRNTMSIEKKYYDCDDDY